MGSLNQKSFMCFTSLGSVAMILLSSLMACEKGTKVFKVSQTPSDMVNVDSGSGAEGATSGTVIKNATAKQKISAQSGQGIDGASVVFPVGALSMDSSILLGKGSDLASSDFAQVLGVDDFSGKGNSIVVTSNPQTDAVSPMVISIPVPNSTRLFGLASDDVYVIFQSLKVSANSKYWSGIVPHTDVTIVNNQVQIQAKYFGTYQAVRTPKAVTKKIEFQGTVAELVSAKKTSTSSTSVASTTSTTASTSPSVTIGAPSLTAIRTGTVVTFPVTYVNTTSQNLLDSNITVTTVTGDATAFGVTVSGGTTSTPTISINTVAGNGTVTVAIGAGTCTATNGESCPASNVSAPVTIDNTAPAASFVNASPSSPGNSPTPAIVVNLSEATSSLQLFATPGCSSGSKSNVVPNSSFGNVSITTTAFSNGITSSLYLKAQDAAGNVSCTSLGSYLYDGTVPTIVGINAVGGSGAGNYYPGDSIYFDIQFSENVVLSGGGTLSLALNSGRSANYFSGSGTTLLRFRYVVLGGDTSGQLDYSTSSSLSVTGTLQDAALNNANLNLFTPNTPGSLGYNIVRVVFPTTIPVIAPNSPPFAEAFGLTQRPTAKVTIDQSVTSFKFYSNSNCSTQIGADLGSQPGATALSLKLNADLATPVVTTIYAQATSMGVTSLCTYVGNYTTGIYKISTAKVSNNAGTPVLKAAWACAIVNGGLKCWGQNSNGQIQGVVNSPPNYTVPFQTIAADSTAVNPKVTDVAMSAFWDSTLTSSATCAVVNGGIQCWGDDTYGQIGNGSAAAPSGIYVSTYLPSGVTNVYGSTGTFCAIKSGDLYCWGHNAYGQVGNGGASSVTSPYKLTTLPAGLVTDVAMADGLTCAIADGGVWCWGINTYGAVGNGSMGTTHYVPYQVYAPGSGATKVHASEQSVCAIVSGSVKCWGDGTNGRLGNNNNIVPTAPDQVYGLTSGFVSVIAGSSGYAINSASALNSWGKNDFGQLFNSASGDQWIPLSPMSGGSFLPASYSLTGFGTSTAEGTADVVCFVVNGGVFCRGAATQSSYMGIGSYNNFVIPTSSNVVSVSANKEFGCAVIANMSAQCWGRNNWGQLGNGATNSATYTSPATISGLGN